MKLFQHLSTNHIRSRYYFFSFPIHIKHLTSDTEENHKNPSLNKTSLWAKMQTWNTLTVLLYRTTTTGHQQKSAQQQFSKITRNSPEYTQTRQHYKTVRKYTGTT